VTAATVSSTEQQLSNEHALLGAALLSAQKVEFSLYTAIAQLLKTDSNVHERQAIELNVDTFLKGTSNELSLVLDLYYQVFGNKIPLTKAEVSDFVFHRNLISRNYWRATGAEVKGGEKLGNPEGYLSEFLTKCENWQAKLA